LLQVSDEAEADNAVTNYTAWDPWKYLYSRPVMHPDGTLPGIKGACVHADRPGGDRGDAAELDDRQRRAGLHRRRRDLLRNLTLGRPHRHGHADRHHSSSRRSPSGTRGTALPMGVIDIKLAPIYDPSTGPAT
jgi:hypothetical protein